MVCASAIVAARKADGTTVWDPNAGTTQDAPPDPVCELKLDSSITMTSAKMNTVTPTWNESITPNAPPLTASRLMSQAMPWSIVLYDEDSGGDDTICQLNPQLSVANFTAGTATFAGPLCPSVTITLTCTQ